VSDCTDPPLSAAYLAAIAAHDAACLVYRAATDAYRMRKIGDAEFLAARATLERAHAAFDAAYAVEAKTSEGEVR
jgi:hypothetical protein